MSTNQQLHYHTVFSTKNRQRRLTDGFREDVFKYMKVVAYIENQMVHHSKQSFEDEYLLLLNKHEIKFDLKYVWDGYVGPQGLF